MVFIDDVLLGFILLKQSKKLLSITETTTSILTLAAPLLFSTMNFKNRSNNTSNCKAHHFSDIIEENNSLNFEKTKSKFAPCDISPNFFAIKVKFLKRLSCQQNKTDSFSNKSFMASRFFGAMDFQKDKTR